MLARWIERGLGSIIAPDENFKAQHPPDDDDHGNTSTSSSFWQIVAPDPVYEEKVKEMTPKTPAAPAPVSAPVPPADAFLSPGFKTENIQCVHCKKMTPLKQSNHQSAGFSTPTVGNTAQSAGDGHDDLNNYVLSATKGYTFSMVSPPPVVDHQNKVFRLCASGKPLQEKLQKKLEKTLTKDKSLLRARSVKLGQLVPDGMTPLMAAAHAGNVSATKILLNIDQQGHLERDLQGRTALHIAAEEGNFEVVEALKERHDKDDIKPDGLLDLAGRTPFGRALTSPVPKTRKNVAKIEKMLFSPDDVSIIGSPPPRHTRQTVHRTLNMVYSQAEMPGYRVLNEDTICSENWHDETTGEFYWLLGVCDGHGDQRQVSEYVSTEIARRIRAKTEGLGKREESEEPDWQALWAQAFLEVDSDLKATGLPGGSTAIMALVTKNQIIVANVGDSRCILVQEETANIGKVQDTPPLAEEEMASQSAGDEGEQTAGADSNGEPGAMEGAGEQTVEGEKSATTPAKASGSGLTVISLSEDHKPNRDDEKARIEKAGLSVVAETFEDNGGSVTIHKVKKSSGSMMAVSRSFGDFEYKGNNELGPEEQAIVAVPDVRIHSRDPEKDLFLVTACDGVWDVMSNFEVAKFLYDREAGAGDENGTSEGRLAGIGDELLRECLNKGSRDNMSIAVAALNGSMEKFTSTGEIQGKALQFSSPGKTNS